VAMMFYASPLAVIKTVIAEKSTKSLPFTLSVASVLSSLSWASYGYKNSVNPSARDASFHTRILPDASSV
jgi:hypothetical protein